MKKIVVFIMLHFLYSCNDHKNTENVDLNLKETDSTIVTNREDINDITTLNKDSLKDFKVIYKESKGVLGILTNVNDFIEIGKYHNTFNQPPHEINVEDINGNKYLIFVSTNQVQMGESQDAINIFGFNKATNTITKLCSFEELGVYSEESGIDTLVDIKLYEYKLIKKKNSNDYEVNVFEYKPYKSGDDRKNTKMKTILKTCDFTSANW